VGDRADIVIDAPAGPPDQGFAQLEREHVRGFYPGFEWRVFDQPSERCPLRKPLERARVALVGTAGAYISGQRPFSLGDEGDASVREIPANAELVLLAHPGYNTRRARDDPDVVFPLAVLRRLAAEGQIGELAPRCFSFMGYIPEAEPLLRHAGPRVARELVGDAVDLALLVPA
jgi:D-proline reductase (dithiol) PrdB